MNYRVEGETDEGNHPKELEAHDSEDGGRGREQEDLSPRFSHNVSNSIVPEEEAFNVDQSTSNREGSSVRERSATLQPRSTLRPNNNGRQPSEDGGSPTLSYTRGKRSFSAADISRFHVRKLPETTMPEGNDSRVVSPGSEYTDGGDDGRESLSPAAAFAASAAASAAEHDV